MPRRSKGPRLYRDPKRGQWVIRDGSRFIRCGTGSNVEAEKFLAQYISHKYKPTPSDSPLITDMLTVYATEVAALKKSARNLSYNISNLLKWWEGKRASDITAKSCRAYAATKNAPAAAADLKALRGAVKYWHQEYGPLASIPTFWRPADNPPKDRWLTREEAARLLRAAKPYRHLRRLILLGLYTGSRPGVLLSLTWDQVNLASGLLLRTPAGKAQDSRKRAPPVKLGRRILGHLRRWHRIDGGTQKYVCAYVGPWRKSGQVEDPHGSWRKVCAAAGLEGVTRHTLRHTRATWLMLAGVDLWEAAGHLGMSTRTLERVYGHHHPKFQGTAANV